MLHSLLQDFLPISDIQSSNFCIGATKLQMLSGWQWSWNTSLFGDIKMGKMYFWEWTKYAISKFSTRRVFPICISTSCTWSYLFLLNLNQYWKPLIETFANLIGNSKYLILIFTCLTIRWVEIYFHVFWSFVFLLWPSVRILSLFLFWY